ncbi:MAG: type III pantothenate kinase [Planctomycetota bacterium]
MQLVAVDIGNSATKLAPFDHRQGNLKVGSSRRWFGEAIDIESFDQFCQTFDSQTATWFFSSVHPEKQASLIQWINEHRPADATQQLNDIPITNDTAEPDRVGRDRLLAALGAWDLSKDLGFDKPALVVVDAGTAVTVDWVDEQGTFRGGNIYLGADSQFSQLEHQTAALPNLSFASRQQRLTELEQQRRAPIHSTSIGRSTLDAILVGTYQSQIGGLTHLLTTLCRQVKTEHGVVIFATGGGWQELDQACQAVNQISLRKLIRANTGCRQLVVNANLVLHGVAKASMLSESDNPRDP